MDVLSSRPDHHHLDDNLDAYWDLGQAAVPVSEISMETYGEHLPIEWPACPQRNTCQVRPLAMLMAHLGSRPSRPYSSDL